MKEVLVTSSLKSGRGSKEHCETGVSFAIRKMFVGKQTGLPKGVNDQLMTMKHPFSCGRKHITIISAYAPAVTNPEVKDRF